MAYLLMIPAFALMFMALPANSFYQSGLLSEEPEVLAADRRSAEHAIQRALDRTADDAAAVVSSACARPIEITQLRLRSLSVVQESRALDITFDSGLKDGPRHYVTDMTVRAFVLQPPLAPVLHKGETLNYFAVERITNAGGFPGIWCSDSSMTNLGAVMFLPPQLPGEPDVVRQRGFRVHAGLRLDASQTAAVRRLVRAHLGDPAAASGAFFRMVYLSAMTITTVGYGDITPVTQAARGLVAAEAVLGVVIAGFFLNSVAARARTRPTTW